VGDDEGSQQPHSFKSASFSIPAQCGYCKSSIWGLSKQGKTCKLCGLSVHSKCELKVPADCQRSQGRRHSSVVSRKPTVASHANAREAPHIQTPSTSSFVQSVMSEDSVEESYPVARMLFDFIPTSEFELDVSEGTSVHVLEPDDGSGWVKVADPDGRDGLVPASYLEYDDATSEKPTSPNPHSHQGSGKYVRGIYPYQSQGTDELGLKEGELVELSKGPAGGQYYGDGWWEGKASSDLQSTNIR